MENVASRERDVLGWAVYSRVMTVALMILANALLPTHEADGVHLFHPEYYPISPDTETFGTSDIPALAAFTRWDAAWMLSIAECGYPSSSNRLRRNEGSFHTCGTEGSCPGEWKSTCDWNRDDDLAVQEQAHAFFPLYPWVVQMTSGTLSRILPSLNPQDSLVLGAIVTSNVCFVVAAVILYRLGQVVLGDELLAYRGAIVFCINPAGAFFSTAYAESLFSMLTFAGLWVLFSGRGWRRFDQRKNMGWRGSSCAWLAAVLLAVATLARSNGVAAAGVLVLEKLRWFAQESGLVDMDRSDVLRKPGKESHTVQETLEVPGRGGNQVHSRWKTGTQWIHLGAGVIATGLQVMLIFLPYLAVQYYAYLKFCGSIGGEVDEVQHSWCKWRVPSLYAYVQAEYWGVGLFRYYTWKQVPNFLLATPVLLLSITGTVQFFTTQWQHRLQHQGALLTKTTATGQVHTDRNMKTKVEMNPRKTHCDFRGAWSSLEAMCAVFLAPTHSISQVGTTSKQRNFIEGEAATAAVPLVTHWLVLWLIAAVFMNVQVSTRFLTAACPPLHWWTANLMFPSSDPSKDTNRQEGGSMRNLTVITWLEVYMVVYFVVGAVMHANFLPWT
ncbi:unnamed protein product [Choristocarpus tenellus]